MQYTFRTMTGARTQEYRDQQRRAYEAKKLARRELKAEAQAKHKTMTEKATDPILVKVIEHHTPDMSDYDDYPWCEGCDPGAYAEDNPDWPCSTIGLIETHLAAQQTT